LLEVPQPSPSPTIQRSGAGQIGLLRQKRFISNVPSESQRDLDWAVCTLENNPNKFPDGNIEYPKKIVQRNPSNASVLVHTGTTGVVKGAILGDCSLIALPGSKKFQRMWVIILERHICE
jgi:hypothetical protein